MLYDTPWHDAKRGAWVHLNASDLCGADVSREVQRSIVLHLDLHIFWSEDNVCQDMGDAQALWFINRKAGRELGDEDFGVCSASLRAYLVYLDSLRSS